MVGGNDALCPHFHSLPAQGLVEYGSPPLRPMTPNPAPFGYGLLHCGYEMSLPHTPAGICPAACAVRGAISADGASAAATATAATRRRTRAGRVAETAGSVQRK